MSVYQASIQQMKKMLHNLDRWLDAGVAHAQKKKFDPDLLCAARLAPDQYPLTRQVGAACDAAKFATARLGGKEMPAHADTEKTMAELHARIASVLSFIDTFSPEDFAEAAKRPVALPFMPGKAMSGPDYLVDLALPNFYFHVVTAYAILRHSGVDLGKHDYLGDLKVHDLR